MIRAESPSVQIMKRVGKRGSPCLSPRVGMMLPQAAPVIITEYETEVIHFITRFTHLELNPSFSSTLAVEFNISKNIIWSGLLSPVKRRKIKNSLYMF